MAHLRSKEIANGKISSRFKQAFVLFLIITVGILLSSVFGDFQSAQMNCEFPMP